MSDQIEDNQKKHQRELAELLEDIGRLRDELKPKHVHGHVLPDGRVVLANGDIVDGVRGAPVPGALPPVVPADGSHVKGRVLPNGTVMVGDRVVDGIRGAAAGVPTDYPAEQVKDMEQDRKLATLQDKGE